MSQAFDPEDSWLSTRESLENMKQENVTPYRQRREGFIAQGISSSWKQIKHGRPRDSTPREEDEPRKTLENWSLVYFFEKENHPASVWGLLRESEQSSQERDRGSVQLWRRDRHDCCGPSRAPRSFKLSKLGASRMDQLFARRNDSGMYWTRGRVSLGCHPTRMSYQDVNRVNFLKPRW